MRRIVSSLSFVVGVALLASALLNAPVGRSATEERVLRLNLNSTDITYLDPALNYDFYGWRLEAATCAMLLGYPDKAGRGNARLYPEVAKAFPKVSDGGKTYTFTLRSGYRFSDGSPVTAESYARAIERALSPKMEFPRGDVPERRRGRRAGAGRQGDTSGRRDREREHAHGATHEGRPRLPLAHRDAVLLRGPAEPADRPAGRQHAAGRRPLLRLEQEEGDADHPAQEPLLPPGRAGRTGT